MERFRRAKNTREGEWQKGAAGQRTNETKCSCDMGCRVLQPPENQSEIVGSQLERKKEPAGVGATLNGKSGPAIGPTRFFGKDFKSESAVRLATTTRASVRLATTTPASVRSAAGASATAVATATGTAAGAARGRITWC
jgi:hypothetical protein